ncbi:cytochrome P450 4B1-like isoform X2 [Hyperolius riggenbachi]|uniref:cytochrome P450 4B1-like isoform X2 n=1 Tax=Hyperolius riggenbachi TaxID=752182 RepID=UPI0035A33038
MASYLSVDIYQVFYIIAAFFLSVLLLKTFQMFQKRWALVKALESFPGPPTHWLYGNTHQFLHDNSLLVRTQEWALQYPYATPVWFGKFVVYVNITHPDYAKTLLARAGQGLLVSSGQKWFQHRRLLTPAFHYDILKAYVKLMSDSTHVMLNILQDEVTEGTSVDICPYVTTMTLDTLMKCLFGYKGNSRTDRDNPYQQAVIELSHLIYKRFFCIPYHSDLIFSLSPDGWKFRRLCGIAHDYTDRVIKERRESLQHEEELEQIRQNRHLDFLDILLCARYENGKSLSDEDLRAEVDTFMFEGHDATASGISWILHHMAQNPEHQQKCREEVQELLGDRDTIEWDDLNQLPYTTMCIKESLRFCPAIPLIARQLSKPMTFCDGRSLPAGCLVSLCVISIHMNPEFWKDPEVFDPLRFSPENSAHRHPHAYIPFSGGPRNCIGQTFAMNELKVALALILNMFELAPDPTKPPYKQAIVALKSENGIHLKLTKLQGKKRNSRSRP